MSYIKNSSKIYAWSVFVLTCKIVMLLSFYNCYAKDLGVQGQVFKITEESLLDVIKGKLQALSTSGKLKILQQDIARRAQSKIERPTPVRDVKKTIESRQFTYDPTLILTSDIMDHRGRVFARKGQKFNPLEYVSWGVPLILFDGNDPEQVIWAREQGDTKWVLVAGAIGELMQVEKRDIYFDQGGLIVKRFGISQVPCRISQKGKVLFIEEVLSHQKRGKL